MDKELVMIKAIIKADYERHIKRFETSKEMSDILFLGDSIMAYAPLKKMGYQEILNQGIPGDTTLGVMNRLSYVYQAKPKIVFLHIGSNDLVLTEHDEHQIILNIQKIVHELNTRQIKVYLLSITPVLSHHTKTNQTYVKNRTNDKINHLNDIMRNLDGIELFIDVNEILKDKNHQLHENYTTDGVHLNDLGYELFFQELKPWIMIDKNERPKLAFRFT